MAQWVTVPAAKPEELNPIPGIHVLEGKNPLSRVVL